MDAFFTPSWSCCWGLKALTSCCIVQHTLIPSLSLALQVSETMLLLTESRRLCGTVCGSYRPIKSEPIMKLLAACERDLTRISPNWSTMTRCLHEDSTVKSSSATGKVT